MPEFVAEVTGFTGVSDTYDDQVDALATAVDCAQTTQVIPQIDARALLAIGARGGFAGGQDDDM